MQTNDRDLHLPGNSVNHREMGEKYCSPIEQEEAWAAMNVGYRWLKVNNHVYVYVATRVQNAGGVLNAPQSEILAYVQQTGPNGKFRALRSYEFCSIVMPIPFGSAEEMILEVEKYIQEENLEQDIQGAIALDY